MRTPALPSPPDGNLPSVVVDELPEITGAPAPTPSFAAQEVLPHEEAPLEGHRPPLLYSPHSFRVTTITDLLEQSVPLEEVQRLAGHADPRSTGLYDRCKTRPEDSPTFHVKY